MLAIVKLDWDRDWFFVRRTFCSYLTFMFQAIIFLCGDQVPQEIVCSITYNCILEPFQDKKLIELKRIFPGLSE